MLLRPMYVFFFFLNCRTKFDTRSNRKKTYRNYPHHEMLHTLFIFFVSVSNFSFENLFKDNSFIWSLMVFRFCLWNFFLHRIPNASFINSAFVAHFEYGFQMYIDFLFNSNIFGFDIFTFGWHTDNSIHIYWTQTDDS